MPTPTEIITAARTWLGTPYHHQGRVKGVGVDCIGIIVGVAADLGFNIDKDTYRAYPRQPPRGKSMLHEFAAVCGDPINEIKDLKIGDLAIFWMSETSKRAQHCGIISDIGMIHCYSTVGKVVEHPLDMFWYQRFMCGFKFVMEK